MVAEARERPAGDERSRAALTRLHADGYIVRHGDNWKTGRRFQQAMARAAVRLYEAGDPGDDLRVPIALAVVELYADAVDDETMAQLVLALLPIEAASLGLVR